MRLIRGLRHKCGFLCSFISLYLSYHVCVMKSTDKMRTSHKISTSWAWTNCVRTLAGRGLQSSPGEYLYSVIIWSRLIWCAFQKAGMGVLTREIPAACTQSHFFWRSVIIFLKNRAVLTGSIEFQGFAAIRQLSHFFGHFSKKCDNQAVFLPEKGRKTLKLAI